MSVPPALVVLHVWGTSAAGGVWRTATQRRPLRRFAGCSFAKLLGTGSGRTFTLRDADLTHWAVLTCWTTPEAYDAYQRSALFHSWQDAATEQCHFHLRPLRSQGRWAGQQPFGVPVPERWEGPVAALTRARIRPAQWLSFWRSVPAVAQDAHGGAGLQFALGVGEAPLGWQGTFTVWRDSSALDDFAYRRGPHVEVVRRTRAAGWYAEELFARFALLDADGCYHGTPVRG